MTSKSEIIPSTRERVGSSGHLETQGGEREDNGQRISAHYQVVRTTKQERHPCRVALYVKHGSLVGSEAIRRAHSARLEPRSAIAQCVRSRSRGSGLPKSSQTTSTCSPHPFTSSRRHRHHHLPLLRRLGLLFSRSTFGERHVLHWQEKERGTHQACLAGSLPSSSGPSSIDAPRTLYELPQSHRPPLFIFGYVHNRSQFYASTRHHFVYDQIRKSGKVKQLELSPLIARPIATLSIPFSHQQLNSTRQSD